MRSSVTGGPSLLLALPPGGGRGTWPEDWRCVLDAWPGDWHVLDPDPHYVDSWRRRALENCADCWTVMPEPGCVPGALAFSLALRTMVEEAQVACVSIVPADSIAHYAELTPATHPFLRSPFVAGGVIIAKSPLAVKDALPEPRFYPYDFAESTFRMSQKGLTVLVLPDPSFSLRNPHASLLAAASNAWREGRGATQFRLAHKGVASRSLRLPDSRLSLLLLAPWLIASTACRMAARRSQAPVRGGILARALSPALLSAAFLGGVLSAYSDR